MTTPHPSKVPQKSRRSVAQVPLLSIGVPTHNAERFIERSLDSILAINYPQIEVHINDNGSADQTVDIALRRIAKDKRARLTTWERDRGAADNFNYLLREASGEYFMWASDHDLWDPDYATVLIAELESNDRAVLAYAQTTLIAEDGSPLGVIDDFVDVSDPSPRRRYVELIWRLGACNMVYGIARRESLLSTGGVMPIVGPDNFLLAQLAMRGTFIRVSRPMFFRRQNRTPTHQLHQDRRDQVERIAGPAATIDEPDDGSPYRALRDRHLGLVRRELRGWDRVAADLATRHCFHARLGVGDPLGATQSLVERMVRRAQRSGLGYRTWMGGDRT